MDKTHRKIGTDRLEPGEELIEIIWIAGPSVSDVILHLAENHLISGKKFSDYRKLDVHYRYQGKPENLRIENISKWERNEYPFVVGIDYVSDTSFRRIVSECGIHALVGRR